MGEGARGMAYVACYHAWARFKEEPTEYNLDQYLSAWKSWISEQNQAADKKQLEEK